MKTISDIDLKKIKELKDDEYELALAKMIYLKIAKTYYRDEEFFLFKENLKNRKNIYDSEIQEGEFNITCNSLCKLFKCELSKYNIDSEIISPFNDEFKHSEIMIITKKGTKYVIDPLMDLIKVKTNKKTKLFASQKSAEEYANIDSNISYINEYAMSKIDETIGYEPNDNFYEEFKKCNEDQEVMESIKFLLDHRGDINGIVDLMIYFNMDLKKICASKIKVEDFFIEPSDVVDDIFKSLEFNSSKIRGLLISDKDRVFVFPFANNTYKCFKKEEWEKLSQKNNINIKEYINLKCLKYLKDNAVDRNILHNRKFLYEMQKIEEECEKNGKNIIDYVSYQNGHLFISYKCSVEYYIKENNLVKIDHLYNSKKIYIYEDENNVNIRTMHTDIMSHRAYEYLDRTDICGIFNLVPENSDVLPYLTNNANNYLSRNYNEYYLFESYNDLLNRRSKIINILLKNGNLTSDEKYILLENILNISAKIYYISCLNAILDKNYVTYLYNYKNFVNDINIFISFIKQNEKELDFKDYKNIKSPFFEKELLYKKRQVELDNKIYILDYLEKLFKTLDSLDLKEIVVLTTGYGSIYMGPFMKALKDIDSTIVLYSQYKKLGIDAIDSVVSPTDVIINPNILKNKDIVLVDDNIGTGTTLKNLRKKLQENGYNVSLHGSYQYTFDRLQEFTIKSRNQELFEPKDMDLLTPINYPRHHIIEKAVDILRENPTKYISYLNLFGYHTDMISDYNRNLIDAIFFYKRYTNKKIYEDEELKSSSKTLIKQFLPKEKIESISDYL